MNPPRRPPRLLANAIRLPIALTVVASEGSSPPPRYAVNPAMQLSGSTGMLTHEQHAKASVQAIGARRPLSHQGAAGGKSTGSRARPRSTRPDAARVDPSSSCHPWEPLCELRHGERTWSVPHVSGVPWTTCSSKLRAWFALRLTRYFICPDEARGVRKGVCV